MSILQNVFSRNTLTYIANAGVMISLKNTKIIIDGVVEKLDGKYRNPEDDFSEKLILDKEPYHNIDYVFTTHSHKDHITPYVANEFMRRNRHVKFIGPTAVTRFIKSERNFNEVLSPQIFTVSLKPHKSVDVTMGDMSFTAYRLPHDGTHHSTLENIAYHIYADNTSIVALGDAAARVLDFEKAGLTDKCDILICHANMIGQKSGREIIEKFSPKHLALCHIGTAEGEVRRISSLLEKHKKTLPKNAYILTTAGEMIKL